MGALPKIIKYFVLLSILWLSVMGINSDSNLHSLMHAVVMACCQLYTLIMVHMDIHNLMYDAHHTC